ncbi:hypothetical protein F5148DRAFT_325986 [Russula earlei]|uniref:Uncharacterized protein n=1 Tax=Russula earlei TaxID=71964 RepID=A0ACC0UIZ6_9AGAM|nr:hypothetical protein F5148DRAFT_325986 [Russula earlei]
MFPLPTPRLPSVKDPEAMNVVVPADRGGPRGLGRGSRDVVASPGRAATRTRGVIVRQDRSAFCWDHEPSWQEEYESELSWFETLSLSTPPNRATGAYVKKIQHWPSLRIYRRTPHAFYTCSPALFLPNRHLCLSFPPFCRPPLLSFLSTLYDKVTPSSPLTIMSTAASPNPAADRVVRHPEVLHSWRGRGLPRGKQFIPRPPILLHARFFVFPRQTAPPSASRRVY